MWKKTLVTALALLLCWGMAGWTVPKAAASSNTYYVATTGSDTTGDGTLGNPWRTIQQAATVAAAGDTVLIRGGTYRETVTPANSGNDVDGPITFRNYNGELVVVNGADLVTGWTKDTSTADPVYKATPVSGLGDVNQIFADGAMLDEARWPNNAGTLLAPTTSTMQAGSNTTVTDSALPGSVNGYYNGAKVWVQAGAAWATITQNVTAYNATAKTLTITSRGAPNASYDPKAGNTYYIYGLRALLDTEREWWYDSSGNTLYLWAPGGMDPTTLPIEAKARKYGFELSGKTDIVLDGINLFATSVNSDASSGGIEMTNFRAKYISHNSYPTGNAESNVDSGINLYGDGNAIRNCELAYSSAGLLTINGSGTSLFNCYLHDANYGGTWSGSVTADGADIHIAYNTIVNAGRGSITSKEGIYGGIIEHNELANAGLLTNDGGMLYFANIDGMGTEIRYNKIHDIASHLGIGIYLDNYSSNYVIHHNVIWNTAWDAIRINKPGNFVLVFNNTAYNTGNFSPAGSFNLFGSRFYNNIMPGVTKIPNDPGLAWSSNIVSGATPGFIDAAGGNFRLSGTSIAIDAGKSIPGITTGYAGVAPDVGAYELGASDFAVGHNFITPPTLPPFTHTSNPFVNLAANGGFQLKNLTGWSQPPGGTATVINVNSWGNPNTKVRSQGYGALLKPFDRIEQTITGLTPNTTYTVSGWLKLSAANGQMRIGAENYGGATVDSVVEATSWADPKLTITTGPTNTSATLFIENLSNADAPIVPLATIPLPTASTWYDADVTSYVSGEAAGDGTASFLITGGTPSRTIMISDRTTSFKPYLSVTTTGGGPYTLYPTEDTYVWESEPTTAHDTNPIWIRNSAGGRMAYLKFDLSALSGTVTGAQLYTYVNYRDADASLVFNTHEDDSWSETTLTWNNRPLLPPPVIEGYVDDVSLSLPIDQSTARDRIGDAVLDANSALSIADARIGITIRNGFADAIDDALIVLNDSGATDTELDNAVAALRGETAVFRSRNSLGALIASVQSFHDAQSEGSALYAYPYGSKSTLQDSIDDATDALNEISTSTGDLADASRTLDIALAAFRNSLNKPGVFTLPFVDMADIVADTSTDFTYNPPESPAGASGDYHIFSANVSRYTAQSYTDAVFKFDIKYDFVNPGYYPGFVLRSSGAAGGFGDGNTYLIIFYPTTWELQKFQNNTNTLITSFPNTMLTESNRDYTITIGSVNTPSGVRLLLYVDGVVQFDVLDNSNPVTASGYFGVEAVGSATDIWIKLPEPGDMSDLEDLVDDAQTLHDATTEGTGSGQSAVGAKAVFAAAIARANELLSAPSYAVMQEDADAAETALADAITTFQASINP